MELVNAAIGMVGEVHQYIAQPILTLKIAHVGVDVETLLPCGRIAEHIPGPHASQSYKFLRILHCSPKADRPIERRPRAKGEVRLRAPQLANYLNSIFWLSQKSLCCECGSCKASRLPQPWFISTTMYVINFCAPCFAYEPACAAK